MMLVRLATRYLRGHFRQYLFVTAILVIGFAFISVAASVSAGMERSVTNAALRHYAGHLFVIGRDRQAGSMMTVDDPEVVMDAIERSGAPVERIVRRAHEHTGAEVFFQGDGVRLKDLFGVDFSHEPDLFRTFAYDAGTFDPDWGTDTIVLSRPTAEQLNVQVGERVTLRMENRNRQVDTRDLVVRAITADSGIYGYARAYMARATLSELMGLGRDGFSMVGVFLTDPSAANSWAQQIRRELEGQVPVTEPIRTKEELTSAIRDRWEGVRYFSFALPVYISEVADLLTAMEIGSYLLLGMIVVVVLAGVVVTYRVILHDRAREIGTMLAVGFGRPWITGMLLVEAALLLSAGIILGLAVSAGITWAISLVSFNWIPGFEIFMDRGRLLARYTVSSVLTNVVVVFAVVLPIVGIMVARIVGRYLPALIKGDTT